MYCGLMGGAAGQVLGMDGMLTSVGVPYVR